MDAIVLKALTKDPDYRYQSADEMRADIEAYLDGQPVAATAAMGAVGYGYGGGSYSDGAPTTALPPQDGGPKTSMMPPMRDDDGYGYDDRPDRRRQKKSNTSTVLLVLAGVLVLIGAIFIGKSIFAGQTGSNKVAAPDLVGQTLQDARTSAANVGLNVTQGGSDYCDQDKNKICSQNPPKDTPVDKNSTITVVISKGARPVAVPDETGKAFADAQQDLQSKGFTNVVSKNDDGTSGKPANTVLDQNPSAGTEVDKGAKITLTIAAAPQQVTVPPVVGQQFDAAKAQLENIGFQVVKSEADSAQPAGTVIAQSPAGNSQANKGATVTLTVSKGQATTTLPGDIVGKKLKDVQSELSGLNLNLQVQGPQDDRAVVINSNPAPGSQVKQGDTVVLQTADAPGGGNGGNGGGFGGLFGGQNG